MVALALFLALISRTGILDPVQDVFLQATGPIGRGVTSLLEPVSNLFGDAGELDRLQDDNRRLRIENEALRNENAALRADSDRLTELELALNVVTEDPTAQRLAAGVLSRIQGPFTREMRIDKGSSDGVSVGNPVLSAQGTLVGTVTETLRSSSFVRLLTDGRSSIAARVLGSPADGVVRGDGGALTFDLVEGAVSVGDTIVTSGLGGLYPSDIPIGQVSELLGDQQEAFPTVRVETPLRISTARTLLVVTSFTPVRFDAEE